MCEKKLQGVLNSSLPLPSSRLPIFPIYCQTFPMRTLTTFLCLTFAVLLFSAGEGFALPPCPEDQDQRFHNCFGTYTFASGNKYVGEWRDDKQHGQGTYTTGDGNKYAGEYRDGKRNGHFTVTYANGDKYVGEYRDDKYNGQGTYTFADGIVVEGIWERGCLEGSCP